MTNDWSHQEVHRWVGRTSGATGSVHGACEASRGSGHGPDGRLGPGDSTCTQFNHAAGPLV